MVERLRNTQKEKRSLKAKCTCLSGKLRRIVKKEGIRVSSEDSEDLSQMMDELSPMVDQDFNRESPQYLLWQEQLKYNNLKKKQQMCWHPFIIRFALNLLYSSRAAYHAMTSTGFLFHWSTH